MPSYDYNTQPPPEDDNNSSGGNYEDTSLGIKDAVEKCVSVPLHIAGKVAGTGLHLTGRIFGKLF